MLANARGEEGEMPGGNAGQSTAARREAKTQLPQPAAVAARGLERAAEILRHGSPTKVSLKLLPMLGDTRHAPAVVARKAKRNGVVVRPGAATPAAP
jgi:hypothetical protein